LTPNQLRSSRHTPPLEFTPKAVCGEVVKEHLPPVGYRFPAEMEPFLLLSYSPSFPTPGVIGPPRAEADACEGRHEKRPLQESRRTSRPARIPPPCRLTHTHSSRISQSPNDRVSNSEYEKEDPAGGRLLELSCPRAGTSIVTRDRLLTYPTVDDVLVGGVAQPLFHGGRLFTDVVIVENQLLQGSECFVAHLEVAHPLSEGGEVF